MGKPAARLGDMTMHGGSIVLGFPMVLIGGMPAARIGDMHICPMLTPGVPPIPHVGGPVVLGSPMVLIGGMPAARMGDMLVCVGPPDTIALGCPTVLIGEGGSGSASGGGAGFKAVAVAKASALRAINGVKESTTKQKHWVEFEFVDKAGNPVSGVNYKLTDTANKESGAVLRMDGRIRRDNIKQGQAKVQLFNVSNAKWSKDKAEVGEKVKLTADVVGFEDGTKATIEIYKRDIKGADAVIKTIETNVKNKKVEAEWEYEYNEDTTKASANAHNTGNKNDDNITAAIGTVVEDGGNDEENEEEVYLEEVEEKETYSENTGIARAFEDDQKKNYSSPEYYFKVKVGSCEARSYLLEIKNSIKIFLKDNARNSVGNAKYKIYFDNGEIKEGILDSSGYKKIENAPPVAWSVEFPEYQQVDDFHEE